MPITRPFLSTLSLRRATTCEASRASQDVYFYPRSPCGERRWLRCWKLAARDISIHALLAESDSIGTLRTVSVKNFYPRSPCGERPTNTQQEQQGQHISIHALLAESDSNCLTSSPDSTDFYPRSPCGERREMMFDTDIGIPFLSTLSLRRATNTSPTLCVWVLISIHALLAESDLHAGFKAGTQCFISIHALLAESDLVAVLNSPHSQISIHALLAESDLKTPCVRLSIDVFLSTLSLRRATQL